MEPMNTFLTSHRQDFKTFVDNICSIDSASSGASPIPPSYSTPLAILTRLPPTSREGFPSLPYLVDHAKNFASLVNLWLDHASGLAQIQETDGDLLSFHHTCQNLRRRTEECLASAERAERPNSALSFRWEELVEGLENTSTQPANTRSLHSRVGSSSASIATSNPESPNGPAPHRERSIDMTQNEDLVMRARSRTGNRHNSHSSPGSSAPSPYLRRGSEGDFSQNVTPPRSAHDDVTYASTSKSSNSSRTALHGYGGSNQETPKAKDRNASRGVSTQQVLDRKSSRTPSHAQQYGISPSTSTAIRREHQSQSSSSEERSWLGDMTSGSATEEEEAKAAAALAWGSERERAWKSEGEGLVRTGTANGRPTRKVETIASKRHAVLQQRAEEMEPGERERGTRKVSREPRRDWANEERQRRLVIDMAAERAAAITAAAFHGDKGMSGRSGVRSTSTAPPPLPQPPGSAHSNSYPGSRLQSRQNSISSGMQSGDEETTALPRIQYKNAAAAVGAELGLGGGEEREREREQRPGNSRFGSFSGGIGGKGEREGEKGKEGKEKNVFERIGFKKKRGV